MAKRNRVYGAGTRYDKWSAEWFEEQRKQAIVPVFNSYGKRFCEYCKKFKPKTAEKAMKGWKCIECRSKCPPLRVA